MTDEVLFTPGDRQTAAVAGETLRILRERCVPEFGILDANPRLSDRHFTALIEWADDLGAADPSTAFDLEVLEAVLPALNAALVASYSFAGTPAEDPSLRGREVDLVLTDLGGAALVEMTLVCARLLAVTFQGAAGLELIESADSALRETMRAISGAIAQHG